MHSIHCLSVLMSNCSYISSSDRCSISLHFLHSVLLHTCHSIFPPFHSSDSPNYNSSVYIALHPSVLPFICCIVFLSLSLSTALSARPSVFSVHRLQRHAVHFFIWSSRPSFFRFSAGISLHFSVFCPIIFLFDNVSVSPFFQFSVPSSVVTSPSFLSIPMNNELFAFLSRRNNRLLLEEAIVQLHRRKISQ